MRESRTYGSVGAPGGQPPRATQPFAVVVAKYALLLQHSWPVTHHRGKPRHGLVFDRGGERRQVSGFGRPYGSGITTLLHGRSVPMGPAWRCRIRRAIGRIPNGRGDGMGLANDHATSKKNEHRVGGQGMLIGLRLVAFSIPAAFVVRWFFDEYSNADSDASFWIALIAGLALGLACISHQDSKGRDLTPLRSGLGCRRGADARA